MAYNINKCHTFVSHVANLVIPTCFTPGPREENGDLPFEPKLRAPDERRKTASGDSSSKEHYSDPSSQRESRNYSNAGKGGVEVTSPAKNKPHNKRKEAPKQVYRHVDHAPLLLNDGTGAATVLESGTKDAGDGQKEIGEENELERNRKKKKPTPENSAMTAEQRC